MSDVVQCHRHDKGPALRLAATPVEVRPDGRRIYEGTATFGDTLKPYPDLDPPRVEFKHSVSP